MTTVDGLRTGAWYGDRELRLRFPDTWRVSVLRPDTPPPLTGDQIADALRQPVGQPPISELARGCRRALVILDDLTRPTPAERMLPPLLRQLEEAGVEAADVTLMMGSGTHGPPPGDAMEKKVGRQVASSCRVAVHDDRRNLVKVGRTSFGTPVLVDREVIDSDFVVGIGGIYPQHSTGFGGGSKLALGVLGRRSIAHLHYRHPSMRGSYETDNDFRRDLDEVARMIGLRTTIGFHLDSSREAVRVVSGDHELYYTEAVAFSKQVYKAPLPGDADVVVSNAYPMDVSLTFMRSKGVIPLTHAAPGASRILIAACPEGVGHHGLFPFMNGPRFARERHLARTVLITPGSVPRKLKRKVVRTVRRQARAKSNSDASSSPPRAPARHPIWLYAPADGGSDLPDAIPGMRAVASWEDTVRRVAGEQVGRKDLRVAIYACAALQVLELDRSDGAPAVPGELGALA